LEAMLRHVRSLIAANDPVGGHGPLEPPVSDG
jgi:hypothetical protein